MSKRGGRSAAVINSGGKHNMQLACCKAGNHGKGILEGKASCIPASENEGNSDGEESLLSDRESNLGDSNLPRPMWSAD